MTSMTNKAIFPFSEAYYYKLYLVDELNVYEDEILLIF